MKTLTDEQLAVAIPAAFPELFPDAMKHDWEYFQAYGEGSDIRRGSIYDCIKCGKRLKHQDGTVIDETMTCKHVTPIVIDWNTAHKVAAEVDAVAFGKAMMIPYRKYKSEVPTGKGVWVYETWLTHKATPSDYLRAALKAVKAVE